MVTANITYMKARFSTLLSAIATNPMLSVGIVALVGASVVGLVYMSTLGHPQGTYTTAVRAPIVAQVNSTATVKASESIELAFGMPGRVAQVSVLSGTHVSAGTVIARLDTTGITATRAAAQGNLSAQEARLAGLQSGTRQEALTIAQTAVNGAVSLLGNARQTQRNAVRNAYTSADDAIHNKVDQFFINPRTAIAKLSFTVPNMALQNTIQQERIAIEPLLTTWHSGVYAPSFATATDTGALSASARKNLNTVSSFLSQMSKALSITPASAALPLSTLRAYQASVAIAQNEVSGALGALTVARTNEHRVQSALERAREQLTLEQSGATTHAIKAQEAQVAVARAALAGATSALTSAVIRAPVAGTVIKQNAHVGQTVLPGMPLVSFISDGKFEADAYVSQMELAKIKLGDTVEVALIAYGNTTPLKATVTEISSSPTIQNGVTSYKVTATFAKAYPILREGLSASLRIITTRANTALVVPTSAVFKNGNRTFVLVRGAHHKTTQVTVTTGITSASGMTQILSGIKAGTQVETFGGVKS